jgi:hypothetical protein
MKLPDRLYFNNSHVKRNFSEFGEVSPTNIIYNFSAAL